MSRMKFGINTRLAYEPGPVWPNRIPFKVKPVNITIAAVMVNQAVNLGSDALGGAEFMGGMAQSDLNFHGADFTPKRENVNAPWVQTIPSFPQLVHVGCSRLLLSDEVEGFVQGLKEKRDRKKNRL